MYHVAHMQDGTYSKVWEQLCPDAIPEATSESRVTAEIEHQVCKEIVSVLVLVLIQWHRGLWLVKKSHQQSVPD